MSLETDLQSLLTGLCPRVFQSVAPEPQSDTYLVWQAIGGRTLRYVDASAMDKRNVLVQVTAWAFKESDARALIRHVEDALCASPMVTQPQGEAAFSYEEDTRLHGAVQRYSITAPRA